MWRAGCEPSPAHGGAVSIDDVDAAASTKGNGHPWPVGRLRRGRAWRLRSAAEWMKGSYLCGNNATTGASAQAGAVNPERQTQSAAKLCRAPPIVALMASRTCGVLGIEGCRWHSERTACPPEHYDAFDCSALIGQPSGRSRHQPTAAERSLGAVQRREVHAVSCPRQSWRVCRMMIRRSLWPCAARWGGLTDEPADGSWTRPPVGGSRKRILFDNRVYRKCEGQPVGCSLPIDVRWLSEGIQDGCPCVSRDGIRRGAGAVRRHALPFVPR